MIWPMARRMVNRYGLVSPTAADARVDFFFGDPPKVLRCDVSLSWRTRRIWLCYGCGGSAYGELGQN